MSIFAFVTKKADFIVRFLNVDGSLLKTQYVSRGANATAPADPVFQFYIFTGWDKAFTNVTANLIVTAEYQPEAIWNLVGTQAYDVTFDRTATPNEGSCLSQAEITAWIRANRDVDTYALGTVARVLHAQEIDPFPPENCTTYYYKAEAKDLIDPFFFTFEDIRLDGGEVRSNDFTMADGVDIYTTIATDLIISDPDPLNNNGAVQYQIGSGSWTNVPEGGTISLSTSDVIRFRITSLTTDNKYVKLTVRIGNATGHLVGVWDTVIEYTLDPRYTFNIETLSATSALWTSTVHTVTEDSTLYLNYTESDNQYSKCEYKKNADAWVEISNSTKNATVSVLTNDTMQFRFTQVVSTNIDCNLYVRIDNASGFLVGSWFAGLGEIFKLRFFHIKTEKLTFLSAKRYFTNEVIIPRTCSMTFYGSSDNHEVIVNSTTYKMNVTATIAGVSRNTRTLSLTAGDVIQLVFVGGTFTLTYPQEYWIRALFPDSSNVQSFHISFVVSSGSDVGTLYNN